MTDIASIKKGELAHADKEQVFVTVYIDDQLFGIPVEKVQDILIPSGIADIPLAPNEIAGAINLRGRIVTVIDIRKRLELPPSEKSENMCTTVEYGEDLYSLKVDNIGAVITLPLSKIEDVPGTMNPRWQSISKGVVQLEKELMLVLDIDSLFKENSKNHSA
ncbi:MAG: chemotaxis protein CheW [Alphaproteobacteria bacterium]|nr:chemotaxis protein CheW [Alphaproteobacteria bacterium]